MDVTGRRVLITGASRGIGQALAEAFAGAGATVALVARSEEALRELAAELGGTAHPADLLDRGQLSTLLQRVEDEAGPVDVLVNNAGIGPAATLWLQSPDEVRRTVDLDLAVPLELCRQVVPRMLRRGGGHVVNIASLASIGAVPGTTAYAGAKAGLWQASWALRMELAGLPVGVTSVLVGGVRTGLLDEAELQHPPFHKGFQRLRRLQLVPDTPVQELAAAVVHGVRKERRTVLLPRRIAPFVGLVEVPRRLTEALLTGVPKRA